MRVKLIGGPAAGQVVDGDDNALSIKYRAPVVGIARFADADRIDPYYSTPESTYLKREFRYKLPSGHYQCLVVYVHDSLERYSDYEIVMELIRGYSNYRGEKK